MIRSAVTISLCEEARGGPFVFWDDLAGSCDKAQKLGFDAIELFPPSPDAVDPGRLRMLLNDHGLALAAVGTGSGWLKHQLHLALPDVAARIQARDYIKAIVDFAAHFKAPAIIGSMQGRSGPEVPHPTALGYLADALEDLGEHAGTYNLPLFYEPLNRYETNLCVTLGAGCRLLRSLSTENVFLLADLFHMNIEESSTPDALRAAAGHVGYVHFVDSNRRPTGSGQIDFAPIAEALAAIGFDGYASAEALPLPDPDTAASRAIAAFRRTFRGDGESTVET